jgi:hypothetical protein
METTIKKETKLPEMKVTKTMFESLLEVQKELKTVVKDKQAYKGTYATIENVWESIRNIINSNGFVVLHQMTGEGIKTTALHQSGEKLESTIPFSGNTDPQEKGKEITYAKRYNINAIFNVIVAEEDNDANKPLNNYQKKSVNGELAAKKLLNAKDIEDSRKIYNALSEEERKTTEVIDAVKFIKTNLK